MQRFVVFQLRQRIFQRAPSRFPSRAVAVETEINTVRLTHQDFDVFRRRRRTQSRHAVAHAELRQRDHVHIAFDHQNPPCVFDRGTPFIQSVKVFPFIKQRRIRRIQIFRLRVIQHPAAETDDLPARIADRKHNPMTEAVVMPTLIVNHHPRIHQRSIRIRLEHLRQRLPAVGGVAQTIMRDDFRAQTALV